MLVKVEVDPNLNETEVLVRCKNVDEEIMELVQKLNITNKTIVAGFSKDKLQVLNTSNIIRFYTENQKVYAQTNEDKYLIRLRLYELEERLNNKMFVRISNSEIVNLNFIKNIDLSFVGTLCLELKNGENAFASRRYVSKIKEVLGI
ncbi:MAG: LytTR family transcriptional regulator [Christensenellaceae bacterium]|nr:LytTR family transcriptional regulator [Christensenellaceae bacterium]